MRSLLTCLVGVALSVRAMGAAPPARPATLPVKSPAAGRVDLLAMGDWGRNTPAQRKVAEGMAAFAEHDGRVAAVLLAGDNFYVPVTSVDDPAWRNVFENVYDAHRLPMPFFAVLGNHDFEGGKATIELDYANKHPEGRWKMPARYYRLDFGAETAGDKPLLTVLMLDSNKQVATGEQWKRELEWIDEQLASIPDGTWKVACAHHVLFTNGSHGDNGVLQTDWGALFKKHHLDLYLCGHDHDLQHLEVPGWSQSFVLVGGGGASTRSMIKDQRGPFSKSINGFGHLRFMPEKLTVELVDADGHVVHAFDRTKAGAVTVLANTPSDKATSKPLRAIQGVGEKKDD